jgi:ribonuclease P protein component
MSAPATFPRAARLLTGRDFNRLREGSRRLTTRHFAAQVARRPGQPARLGLAVSKQVSKKAVRRNRIKRLTRDSFRRLRCTLPDVDILVIAKPAADAADNGAIHAELADLWRRIAALNADWPAGTMRD